MTRPPTQQEQPSPQDDTAPSTDESFGKEAWERICEASEWAPHRRDVVTAQLVIEKAAAEGWTREQTEQVLESMGMDKEAIIGPLLRGLVGGVKAVTLPARMLGTKVVDPLVKKMLVGTVGGAGRAGVAVGGRAAGTLGRGVEWLAEKPFTRGLGALIAGMGGLEAGGKAIGRLSRPAGF